MDIYVVQSGDTVASIARRFGTSEERIISNNEIVDPTRLVVGQTLVIMYPDQVHIVEPGESLFIIAERYNTTISELLQNNPSIIGKDLLPGEELVITYQGNRLRDITINGYAYPYIDEEVLEKTLPYLTYISIFTYGFTPEGELLSIDDEDIIRMAREYGVAPLMNLSTYTEEGIFSSELATTIFQDAAAQNNLIDNILENMRAKDYYGLDIDFEYIRPEDRLDFVDFLQNVTTRLNSEGYEVMVALAPKISAEQRGLLYEAHDYELIGGVADWVLLMTYEWGYTYGYARYRSLLWNPRKYNDFKVCVVDFSSCIPFNFHIVYFLNCITYEVISSLRRWKIRINI